MPESGCEAEGKRGQSCVQCFCALLLRRRGLAAETAGVLSFSDRELLRGQLMPVLEFSVHVTKSLHSSTSSALIRRHGSCLCLKTPQVRGKLPFDKHLDSVLSDLESSLASLPLPKVASSKTRTESQTTSQRRDESKPSKSSLRADRRKRHNRHGYEVFCKLNTKPHPHLGSRDDEGGDHSSKGEGAGKASPIPYSPPSGSCDE